MSLNASTPSCVREPWRYPARKPRHTGLFKCLLISSTLFVLAFCGIILSLRSIVKGSNVKACKDCTAKEINKYERQSSDRCNEVCTTKDCIKTASHIISRTDAETDPCEDFYSFTCAKYNKVPMMEPFQREQFLSDASLDSVVTVRDVIENIPKHIAENIQGYTTSKARNLYESCINYHSTEEMAVPTAFKYLEYFGVKKWPHLDSDYQFINPNLDEIIARLSIYWTNPFINLYVSDDNDNAMEKDTNESSSSNITLKIKVNAPSRQLFFTSVYPKEKIARGMTEILDYFGMPEETINSTVQETLKFDEDLYSVKEVSRGRIAKCSANASISCAAYQFDCFDEKDLEMERWCAMIVKILDAAGMRERYSHFRIVLLDKFYFEDIGNLIDRASHRTVAHGLALQLLLDNSLMMNYHSRRTAIIEMYGKDVIRKLEENRPLFCVQWVIAHLPSLVGVAFYSTKYKGLLEKEGDEIFEDIRSYIISLARNITWMDPSAQESLESQMMNVFVQIHMHTKVISDVSAVDEFHKKLNITDQSFLANNLELNRFRAISDLFYHDNTSLVYNHRRSRFEFSLRYGHDNIYLDFASFIYPLISADRPRYLNMGFYGFFLSHEYSHGVEIFFRDPKNMSSTFENALREKKKCFIDHYSGYTIDLINKQVNGSFTLNENLADYFAIRAAYQALKKYQKKHGIENKLPGIDFNVDQLFFIAVGQSMCETSVVGSQTVDGQKAYLEDPHSPNKYRISGIVKNFETFSEVFNCPLKSPMNPIEKCSF